MKIQLHTVIVPNGQPKVRLYADANSAATWIAENASNFDNKPEHAPATIDVSIAWLEEMLTRARGEAWPLSHTDIRFETTRNELPAHLQALAEAGAQAVAAGLPLDPVAP
jgi:hypothetical protein